jgi:hypothetical protein
VLWILLAACIVPVVASYFLYYVWKPSTFRNYGDLIPVTPLYDAAAVSAASASAPVSAEPSTGSVAPPVAGSTDAARSPLAPLAGKWVLVSIDGGACDAKCEDKLIALRQLRLAQGKEMDRVTRAWLVDDATAPASKLLEAIDGTHVVAPAPRALLGQFPPATADGSARDHLYVIDPLGNLMMRFPKDADPNRIKKDLIHLLRVSRIG